MSQLAAAAALETRQPSPADARRFFDTAIAERGEGYLEHYWATTGQLHRQALVDTMHTLASFQSVVELGVMAGTNLRLVHEAFPWVTLCGSDINAAAIDFARRRLPRANLYVAEPLDFLRAQPDRAADVIFTCYTLAYLDRDAVVPVLVETLRVARRAVICVEPHVLAGTVLLRRVPLPEWAHDYGNILGSHMSESKTRAGKTETFSLARPVDSCNMVTAVRLSR